MRHYCEEWIREWCEDNGWTDLFVERYDNYWAFPPGAVIPEPIPSKILKLIKAEKGFTEDEKIWLLSATIVSAIAIGLSCWLLCPLPLVFAFGFVAVIVAKMEVEDI